MATWSFCGRHAGPDKPPTPVFINLDNVLTVERQGDLTTVLMVGGEKVQCRKRLSALPFLRVLCRVRFESIAVSDEARCEDSNPAPDARKGR